MNIENLKTRTCNALRELSELGNTEADSEVADMTLMLGTANSAISSIERHIQSPGLRANPFPDEETLKNMDAFISKAELFIDQKKGSNHDCA